MKLNKQILAFAHSEADQHLLTDLQFAANLHRFRNGEMSLKDYLNAPHGFKRFLFDYRVGRTLQAGDEAKKKILRIILKFQFSERHEESIAKLATLLKAKELSSRAGTGAFGLPQSFASKLLSIYKPDEVIPFDSYALNAIELHTGSRIKGLEKYYQEVELFRLAYFPETHQEILKIRKRTVPEVLLLIKDLNLNAERLLSWKLTDKYLWCDEYLRRRQVNE